ncbi:MAG: multidrug transporter [Cyanobacteria bacterium P01_A01_bin.37]
MKTDDSSPRPSSPSVSQQPSTIDAPQSTNAVERGAIAPRSTAFKPKSIWPIAILAMLVVMAGVGLKAFRSLRQSPVGQEETTPAQLPVRVVKAELGLAQEWVFDDGIVWPVRRRVLNFEADGDILAIAKVDGRDLREGDYVSRGQVLATIDARKQRSAIDTSEADLEVSIAQRNQADAALIQAEANVDKAQSDLELAESELVRNQGLFEEGGISASDRDVFINRVDQAEAALRSAEQDIRSAEDGVRSAEATIAASQARLRESNIGLEDTQLVSPIDGIVAYINIREGEYWSAQRLDSSSDQSIIESAPIVIVNPQEFEVELELQADDARSIRSGQQAYVVLEEDVSAAQAAGATTNDLLNIAKQQGSRGQVFAVSPTQTPGGRGTEVSIRNFQSVRNLRVGGRAYIWIEAATNANAVMIPLGALLPRDQTFYAFVVNESTGTVERRQVERGIEGLNGVEILSGIEPGDLVVTEGINRLVDGTPVAIVSQEEGL